MVAKVIECFLGVKHSLHMPTCLILPATQGSGGTVILTNNSYMVLRPYPTKEH